MNKLGLIGVIQQATKIVGDIQFTDTGISLLGILDDADLNRPCICALVTEVNAISNLLFERYALPFFAYEIDEKKYALISDFDGEVNHRSISNSICLLMVIEAMQNVFDFQMSMTPQKSPTPILRKEVDINKAFIAYSAKYQPQTMISPYERSEEITAIQVNSAIFDAAKTLTNKKLVTENKIFAEPTAALNTDTDVGLDMPDFTQGDIDISDFGLPNDSNVMGRRVDVDSPSVKFDGIDAADDLLNFKV